MSRLGVMKVLLISAATERLNLPAPPLGMALVAAATRRAGHEVRTLDLLGAPDPARAVAAEIDRFDPEVIGISVRNIDDQAMAAPRFLLEPVRRLVATCRSRSRAAIVLGGAGYSIFPQPALDWLGADLGIQGEGEVIFTAVLHSLEVGDDPALLPGVFARGRQGSGPRIFAPVLDALPFPDPEWLSGIDLADPLLWVPVQTRRGCPMPCIYCSTPRIEGDHIRRRSAPAVVDHLEALACAGVTRVQMVDNTFNLPPSYALELCRRIADRDLGLAIRVILYPHPVGAELVDALARAGCVEASLGFETGAEAMLGPLAKRFDLGQVRDANRRLRERGIRRFGFLLFGGPGETADTIRQSLDFAHDLELDMLRVTVGIRIYPGSPLEQLARGEGVVEPGDDLLRPRFYAAPGTLETVRRELAERGLEGVLTG